jgi:hypothetical protein
MNTEMAAGLNSNVRLLTPEETARRIGELEILLAPAFDCSVGEITTIDALLLAIQGRMFVFVGENNSRINAALIVEFMDFPRRRVLNVVGWAGPSREFYWYLSVLEEWAMANGAKEIRGYGPERAMRHACRFGFQEIYRVYRKELGKELPC